MTRLSSAEYLAHVRGDLGRIDSLLGSLSERGWTALVPGCPGWDLAQLIRHLGGVHRMVTRAIETGEKSRSADHPAPEGADLRAWLTEGGARMLAALDADPRRGAWSFDREERSVGFWQRRQAMENVVHRVDVEQALGRQVEIEPALAADGIGEVVDTLVRLRLGTGALDMPDHAVDLGATDTSDEWRLGTGDAVGFASGTAQELFLALWKRGSLDGLLVGGDALAVARVLALPFTP